MFRFVSFRVYLSTSAFFLAGVGSLEKYRWRRGGLAVVNPGIYGMRRDETRQDEEGIATRGY